MQTQTQAQAQAQAQAQSNPNRNPTPALGVCHAYETSPHTRIRVTLMRQVVVGVRVIVTMYMVIVIWAGTPHPNGPDQG